jgi:hypothetical protein
MNALKRTKETAYVAAHNDPALRRDVDALSLIAGLAVANTVANTFTPGGL